MDALGQFEQLVLTAILALGDDAYGVTIHAKVEDLSKPRKIARGAVYATLDRMEDKGLVGSWMSEPGPERVGRWWVRGAGAGGGGAPGPHSRGEKPGQKALGKKRPPGAAPGGDDFGPA